MTWSTAPQRQFLEDLYAQKFLDAKAAGYAEVEAFHEKTFEDFTSRWPIETAQFSSAVVNSGTPLEVQQKKTSAMQNRLREWFKNKNRPKKTTAQSAPVLNLIGGSTRKPRKRMMQDIEAYNKLYIKDNAEKDRAYEADYAEHSAICKEHGLEPVIKGFFKRDWLRDQYWSEPQELKDLVDCYRKKRETEEPSPGSEIAGLAGDSAESDLISTERQRLAKVSGIQKKVDVLGATLKTIGRELEDQLGAKGFFFVALPEPKADGKLAIFDFGVTADASKQDFETFHPQFDAQVQKVACSWASKCIPKSVRQEFSMTPKLDLDSETVSGATGRNERSARTDNTDILRDNGDIDLDDVGLHSIDPLRDDSETVVAPAGGAKKPANKTKKKSEPKLTEHEVERLERIKEREALMESIGLTGPDGIVGLFKEKPKPKPRAKKAMESTGELAAPRRSSRNKENAPVDVLGDPDPVDERDHSALSPDRHNALAHTEIEAASTESTLVSNVSSSSTGASATSTAPGGVPAPVFTNNSRGAATTYSAPSSERAASAATKYSSGEHVASPALSSGSVAPSERSGSLAVPLASAVLVFDPASITDPRQKKAYAWIPEAEEFLRRHIRGDLADSLIKHWLEFEFRLGFPDSSGRIPKQGRPSVVDNWLKRARNYKKLPDVPPASKYSVDWEKWYRSLQPPGPRQEAGAFPLPQSDVHGDWSKLRVGGANGVFILLITLAFWSVGLQTPDDTDKYESAVGDVLWVLRSMLTGMQPGKRKVDDIDGADEGSMEGPSRHTRKRPLLSVLYHRTSSVTLASLSTQEHYTGAVVETTAEHAIVLARFAILDHREPHAPTALARFAALDHGEPRAPIVLARFATLDRREPHAPTALASGPRGTARAHRARKVRYSGPPGTARAHRARLWTTGNRARPPRSPLDHGEPRAPIVLARFATLDHGESRAPIVRYSGPPGTARAHRARLWTTGNRARPPRSPLDHGEPRAPIVLARFATLDHGESRAPIVLARFATLDHGESRAPIVHARFATLDRREPHAPTVLARGLLFWTDASSAALAPLSAQEHSADAAV
ncbi:hypothetical protein DFH11DRAFT_1834535 [Phellopilus nigrolimitatus]|nr:hypothetical protein DFH11DRAFT_1834535 [Phellopilus nigrolimitatus]